MFKLISGLFCLGLCFTVQPTLAIAQEDDCTISSGAGEIQVHVLTLGQFELIERPAFEKIFSCGLFQNDGSVVVNEKTEIIELEQGSCGKIESVQENHLFYCF